MEKISFWVIFDTCTRPEYYQDVHNVLSMPRGTIIKYNYSKKYFDDLSLDYSQKETYPTTVILLYGQFDEYKRSCTNDDFKKFKEAAAPFFIIPTRFAEIKSITTINEEIYIDLELTTYPYPSNSNAIKNILDSLNNSIPFINPSKYISILTCNDGLSSLKSGNSEDENWAAIINLFQAKSKQFANDSFWRLVGPHEASGAPIEPSVAFEKVTKTVKRNYQSYYKIKEGINFYFTLYNYEPKSSIKSEIIQEAKKNKESLEKYYRSILIDDTYSPVICFIKKIALRQYFITKIKFQKNYNRDLLTKEGACYFSSLGQVDEWPIGPNFYFYFKLCKNWFHLIIGLILVLLSVAFALYSSQIIGCHLWKGIFFGVISTLCIILGSAFLYKQVKAKL